VVSKWVTVMEMVTVLVTVLEMVTVLVLHRLPEQIQLLTPSILSC